jgi:hypothetical protein
VDAALELEDIVVSETSHKGAGSLATNATCTPPPRSQPNRIPPGENICVNHGENSTATLITRSPVQYIRTCFFLSSSMLFFTQRGNSVLTRIYDEYQSTPTIISAHASSILSHLIASNMLTFGSMYSAPPSTGVKRPMSAS